MRITATILLSVIAFAFAGCKNKNAKVILEEFSNNKLTIWNRQLTDIIITDVFSPPVSSRIYAYCNVASYEALAPVRPVKSAVENR